MIWVGGRIVAEDALAIPVDDRAFEHGLGLFETLRTWAGSATLLPRHLERMTRSAAALGLPLDPGTLPDGEAVGRLSRADRRTGDVLVRITLSGGRSDHDGARVWMRHASLPPPPRETGAVVVPAAWTLAHDDPLARHKTLNYWSRRLAYERGRIAGADEVLFATADGRIWEGSRMNLFLVQDDELVTPELSGPVLPGVMRALVLEVAAELGLATCERSVGGEDLVRADEVFLTNAARGIVPVGRIPDRTFAAPGPWTTRLRTQIERRLYLGKPTP
jgi:branched-subunit amino acid aminotransferase/4-amino-4-deoxychorismate lyase